mmetsp:Transcript_101235/g.292746  ORF Transcript_101235/g.292746 Transcript_101235/m.292746 type:complete len:474 (+) Transcript_101235:98-1519(+)
MPRRGGGGGWRWVFRLLGLLAIALFGMQWYRSRRLLESDPMLDEELDEDLGPEDGDDDAPLPKPVVRSPSAEKMPFEASASSQIAIASAALLGRPSKPVGASVRTVTVTTTTLCVGKGLDSVELTSGLTATSWCGARSKGKRLFVAITSPVGNINLRKMLRKRQLLMKKLPAEASYMFFVGMSQDSRVQAEVTQEVTKFGDVVQISTLDTYHNLAVKSFAAAAWAASQLDTAKVRYWLKVEDFMTNDFPAIDTLVKRLISKEPAGKPQPLYYGGGMIFGGTPVIRDGRWGCPPRHCPYKKYPVTYAGGQYMLSMSAATLLSLRGARGLNLKDPYPIEDHFVAQTMMKAAGVKVTEEKSLMWWAGKPYGAPSVVNGDFLLCIDTEDRPQSADDEDTAWEGTSLVLPSGAVVDRAWYGDPNTRWTQRGGQDVTEQLRQALKKKTSPVKVDGATFGDPAPGIRKGLFVKWAAPPHK